MEYMSVYRRIEVYDDGTVSITEHSYEEVVKEVEQYGEMGYFIHYEDYRGRPSNEVYRKLKVSDYNDNCIVAYDKNDKFIGDVTKPSLKKGHDAKLVFYNKKYSKRLGAIIGGQIEHNRQVRIEQRKKRQQEFRKREGLE